MGDVFRSMHLGRHPLAGLPLGGTPPCQVHTPLAGTPRSDRYPLTGTPLQQVHPLAGTPHRKVPPGKVHPPG